MKIPRKFNCPFCHSENSVTISIKFDVDKGGKMGHILCNNPDCGRNAEFLMGDLEDPIDAYCRWRDMVREAIEDDRRRKQKLARRGELERKASEDAEEELSDNFSSANTDYSEGSREFSDDAIE